MTSCEPDPPAIEGTVWERLRERMERLDADSRRAVDPAALAQKLADRARLLRGSPAERADGPTASFLTFGSGHERYGVALGEVVEILPLEHYSPVPRTPSYVVGVIPWRGAIVTLLDPGRLFGVPEAGIADYHVCIVVEAAGRRVALVAREVEDILGIRPGELKPAPDLPGHAPSEWIAGVYDGDRLMLCLARMLSDERFANGKTG